jgi:hypothetical protein
MTFDLLSDHNQHEKRKSHASLWSDPSQIRQI